MRQYFFYAVGITIPLAILGWFLFTVGRALLSLYQDWQLGKELDELQAGAETRRQQRLLENQQRLATGCEHDFETLVSGMPPGTCHKCGLEREKPTAGCDHVWKLVKGPIPSSRCEKCGRAHNIGRGPGQV